MNSKAHYQIRKKIFLLHTPKFQRQAYYRKMHLYNFYIKIIILVQKISVMWVLGNFKESVSSSVFCNFSLFENKRVASLDKSDINTNHDKSVPLKPLINYKTRIDHLNNYARSTQFLAIHQGVSCLCPGVVPLNVIERKHVLKPELNREMRAHLPASALGSCFNRSLFPLHHQDPRASRTFQLHTFQK